ncbi:fimbrial protein [Klebsiella michiganensis]|uniref:fimbrial protein n=1 Tax=Klebsiella michiganensis TaxID=1134687 RepID=UPI0015E54C3D|nr:fimbrial protein [Klebsiella michiganensis]QLP45705.1 fimbrial protein [Klebsiella michiganensis]
MKKTILLLSLSGLSCAALAHDGTVNITGTIQGNTCTVTTDTANQQVTLGDIRTKAFTATGSASQPVKFTIGLEHCGSAASAVSLTFTGEADATNTDLLALTSQAGSAAGVGVAILDSQRTLVPLNSASRQYTLDPQQTTQNLTFYGEMMATSSPVTAGSVDATTTFSLTYQ